jgi:hypothetical protein
MNNCVTKKSCGAIVRYLNFQNESERFKSSHLKPRIIYARLINSLNIFYVFKNLGGLG